MDDVGRRERDHLTDVPEQLLCEVGPPDVRDASVHGHRQQEPPERLVQVHGCLSVVGQEHVRRRREHLRQLRRQASELAGQLPGQSEDRIDVGVLICEVLLDCWRLIHLRSGERPVVGAVALDVVEREAARPDVPAGRPEGRVRVEEPGAAERIHPWTRHVHLRHPWQGLTGRHAQNGNVLCLEAVVVVRVIDDLCAVSYSVQVPDVLAAEMPPGDLVNDLEVQRPLPLHREVDDTLHIVVLTRSVLVGDDDVAPALPRHLPQHARGRRRLKDGGHYNPALALGGVPDGLQVAAPCAGKAELLLGNLPDDIARETPAGNA
mmetsp:Transcript_17205/g.46691  ORF Transcript_17205/g.46691 Transcript_17205/m.46691 type:complete len:320 (-) Transcript_17205:57-1016(-)